MAFSFDQLRLQKSIVIVTFELFAKGNTTGVKLIHEGPETFTANNPHVAAKYFEEGWSPLIGKSLQAFAEK